MNEKLTKWKESTVSFWTRRSKNQKGIFIGSVLLVFVILIGTVLLTSNSNFVPLYKDLSLQEANQVKTELDSRSIPYELTNGGTTISVPEEQVDTLLVELAGQGIPNSGSIDYSFFSENSSWGVTDNEFNIMKLDAMQSELANLIKGIEGINDAQVMINIPEEPIFASEATGEASASIVLNTQPGHQFQGNQINSLYHLVSQAVPNLPQDNIVIMNQYFEYYDLQSQTQYTSQDAHTYQQTVKRDVERDIQRRLQQMLGNMVGMDNVIVSVTADIDFTQENRTEELVEPVDIENMEGLPVSLETIQESYTGDAAQGGVAGTGEEDVPNYPAGEEGNYGEYELDKDTINYEFNRIRREIVESPYKVRDLGIQVAVDSAREAAGQVEYLSQEEQTAVEEGIASILDSIVSTSIDGGYGEFNPEEKVSIVFQEFSGGPAIAETTTPAIPTWMYVTGAILLIIIIVLAILLFRNRKNDEETVEESVSSETITEVPDLEQDNDSESVVRRKQLEKVAKENPEEFAKLLRSWIGQD
ncbi:flagellar basal-body MS-ring/collar protein FliF [Oceanobacillus salinisoli]|uniref:flagellar basal-body MS-ring/collar protein FliF n=1 Tax=Oceanobacillus salinisoli TaxID=2678611 RepID=UPI0012E27D18|nr:flagellar basal-body MS-ring/collar protein FliF [Oceanobacillus salinisoli]